MSTYASDLTASLSTALVQLAPTLVPSSPLPPPPPHAHAAPPAGLAPDQLGATQYDSESLNEARQDRETQLRRVLAQLQPPHASSSSSSSAGPSQAGVTSSSSSAALNGNQSHRLHSPQDLANLAQSLFFPSGDPTTTSNDDPQLATVEYVVLAQLAIAAYGTILRTLMHEAHRLETSDQYWSAVESQPLETALYLVQSSPERALSLGRVSLARFKQLALSAQSKGGTRPAILSRETWRRAVPPSLFLTAVFPHLSISAGLPSLATIYNEGADDGVGGGKVQTGEAATATDPSRRSTTSAAAAAAAVAPANLARLGRQTARSLLFLTLSPLSLTRAEIAHKRRSLREQRDRLATMIGELTLAANAGGAVEEDASVEEDDDERVTKADLRRRPGLAQLFGLAAQQEERQGSATLSLEDVKQATFQTLNHLETVLSPSSADPRTTQDQVSPPPQTPTQLARQLADLLTGTLTAHQSSFRSSSHALAPPSALARAWPYLLSIPLVGGIVARTVYNHRASLRLWAQETVSTVRGFLIDWVVEPVRQILETLRGGEEGGIALMGRESLQSDLASLERMVVDFARDEYKLGPEELQVLAQQVRAGDLTPVLRVWEEDIKVCVRSEKRGSATRKRALIHSFPPPQSPIKSAVRGSLVRTLLIQVQKVKVDVALAMDGIEKMLKSQQLTFGFVGVAPSMLILALVGRWMRGLVNKTDGGSRRKSSEEKRRCWMVIRCGPSLRGLNFNRLACPTYSSIGCCPSAQGPRPAAHADSCPRRAFRPLSPIQASRFRRLFVRQQRRLCRCCLDSRPPPSLALFPPFLRALVTLPLPGYPTPVRLSRRRPRGRRRRDSSRQGGTESSRAAIGTVE